MKKLGRPEQSQETEDTCSRLVQLNANLPIYIVIARKIEDCTHAQDDEIFETVYMYVY